MKEFINDEQHPILKKDLTNDMIDKFVYYECECCGKIKNKRIYRYKDNDFICRECKYKKTSDEKYGGANPGMLKAKKTMLERYGTTSTAQFIDYSKIDYNKRCEKSKQTFIERYSVDNPAKSEEVKNKIKSTNIKKYGVSVAAKNESVKQKQRETIKERYGNDLPGPKASHLKFLKLRERQLTESDITWIDYEQFRGKYDDGPIYYKFKCNKCNNEFEDDFHSGFPICRKCNPTLNGKSKTEIELQDYVKSIYSGVILCNDRTLLNGKELDIYLPEINVAIEYNGTYWHGYRNDVECSLSDFKKNIEFKRIACQERGVRLLTIDECDYLDRPDVFKKFIKDTICPRTRVYARQCDFKEITAKEAKDFLMQYHVNGYRAGYYNCGLYYNDELVCVAVFGKHKKYENECMRLCYKTGYSIVGGWEKIQKHFGKQFLHYVNLKYFPGENKTGCGYRFFLKGQLFSRLQLQKSKLIKMFDDYDDNVSDFVNCLNHNGIAIFDCGNDIRVYNKN